MYKRAWYGHLYGYEAGEHDAWIFYLELKTYDKPFTLQNTLS